ncbi:MAG TPA: hypothetical protein VMH26_04270 [Burkholderiales bacterium]|nr:hypothetical protein [Burkholderiales bacterium]
MVIKEKPVGIWILALWCGAHTIPAILVSPEASGMKSLVIGAVVVWELTIAGGLLIRWRPAQYMLIAQVALHVFIAALVVWTFAFLAFAWGLHPSDVPIVACAVGYLLLVCSAFMYLFHPGVQEYFAGMGNMG